MDLDRRDVDFSNPAHCAAVVDLLDSYAADPIGGGRSLDAGVRERLVPALREQSTALVLLAFAHAPGRSRCTPETR